VRPQREGGWDNGSRGISASAAAAAAAVADLDSRDIQDRKGRHRNRQKSTPPIRRDTCPLEAGRQASRGGAGFSWSVRSLVCFSSMLDLVGRTSLRGKEWSKARLCAHMGGGQADGTQGNVAVASHQAQPNAASCPPSGGAHLPLQLCSASLKTPQKHNTRPASLLRSRTRTRSPSRRAPRSGTRARGPRRACCLSAWWRLTLTLGTCECISHTRPSSICQADG
jgi:hypothetical protein